MNMPGSGPFQRDIRAGHPFDPNGLPYALVPVTPVVLGDTWQANPRLVNAFMDSRPPAEINFGVGDTVGVTIFESAAGGLFIPSEASVRPGNFIELPNQLVDKSGYITVPYAGPIRPRVELPNRWKGDRTKAKSTSDRATSSCNAH